LLFIATILVFIRLLQDANWLAILVNSVHLVVATTILLLHLLHLLLMDQELFLLFRGQLLEEFLLLLGVEALKRRNQLHSLLLELSLLLHRG